MKQRHERAAAREPDGGLAGRVASADHGDPLGAAELRLGWAGGVEDAHALVLGESLDRKAPVLRAGREQDRLRGDLAILFQPQDVASVSRFEGERAVGRGQAGVELPRLGDRAARQLRAAYSSREAEVVLDPPGRAGLPAQCRAVDDQRVEPLGCAVDRGAQARGTRADDDEIDLLPRLELAADSKRAGNLAGRRCAQFCAARQAHQRQGRRIEPRDKLGGGRIVPALGIAPGDRQPVAPRELEHLHGGLR